jgi:pimeloyl-ACP methyl ester carboxylesterase
MPGKIFQHFLNQSRESRSLRSRDKAFVLLASTIKSLVAVKRKVYVIPGFGDSPSGKPYINVRKCFENAGVQCKVVSIRWKYNSVFDYVDQFMITYRPRKNSEVYIFGFSFGALIALMVSTYINPTKLYLCSLSPFFQEDIKKNGAKDFVSLGKRRGKVLRTIPFSRIARTIKCPTIIVVGECELPSVIRRARLVAKEIKRSRLHIASNAGHNLLDEGYDTVLRRIV